MNRTPTPFPPDSPTATRGPLPPLYQRPKRCPRQLGYVTKCLSDSITRTYHRHPKFGMKEASSPTTRENHYVLFTWLVLMNADLMRIEEAILHSLLIHGTLNSKWSGNYFSSFVLWYNTTATWSIRAKAAFPWPSGFQLSLPGRQGVHTILISLIGRDQARRPYMTILAPKGHGEASCTRILYKDMRGRLRSDRTTLVLPHDHTPCL